MNTIESVRKIEQNLKYVLNSNKEYKIVCFGLSNALSKVIKVLDQLEMRVDYICDSSLDQQNRIVYGHKVKSPDALFKLEHKFIVVITSMFSIEIKKQLAHFENIMFCEYFGEIFTLDFSLSDGGFLLELSSNVTNLHLVQNKKYINYASYCNYIIANDNVKNNLELQACKYNSNEQYYKRMLEYYILHRKETIRDKCAIQCLSPFLDNVLENLSQKKLDLLTSTQKKKQHHNNALVLHLYYINMFEEIVEEIGSCTNLFDIYISINLDCSIDDIKHILSIYPQANIYMYENRGRDVLPFLQIFEEIYDMGYKTLCKIHTKKSMHDDNGIVWGRTLRKRLFNANNTILDVLNNVSSVGGFVAKGNLGYANRGLGINKESIIEVTNLLDVNFHEEFCYPMGTMFWCKVDAIKQFASGAIKSKYFSIESGALDGNIEHAIERVVGLLFEQNGYRLNEV